MRLISTIARHGLLALGLSWLAASPALAGWGEAEIRASRIEHHAPGTLPDKPAFAADPLNLFIVIESGDQHLSVIDGERFERIERFASRVALHDGPKFTPDGRYAFFATRDGWVSKFDLWNLKVVAEIRAGIDTRDLAVSGDGLYIAVANELPHTLVLLDAELQPLKVHAAADRDGRQTSPVSAVRTAGPRRSFVAALQDVKEVWELSYDPTAPEIPVGVIHDFQFREGAFVPGFLNPRRSFPDDYLEEFCFAPDYNEILGAARKGGGQVVHLDVRRSIAKLDLPGIPRLGSGISWQWQGRDVIAVPNLEKAVVSIIDAREWQTIRQVKTLGPGSFMRSHETTRYAWVGAMTRAKHKGTLQLIDKQTLQVAAELRPAPGRTLGHVGFTRDGSHALVSVSEDDGAVIVFDATTLKEVGRIAARKPAGTYNVRNEITRAGTAPAGR